MKKPSDPLHFVHSRYETRTSWGSPHCFTFYFISESTKVSQNFHCMRLQMYKQCVHSRSTLYIFHAFRASAAPVPQSLEVYINVVRMQIEGIKRGLGLEQNLKPPMLALLWCYTPKYLENIAFCCWWWSQRKGFQPFPFMYLCIFILRVDALHIHVKKFWKNINAVFYFCYLQLEAIQKHAWYQ